MNVNFYFLDVCLDNANCILQEDLFYERDFEYLKIVFELCKEYLSTHAKNDETLVLYSKLLDVQKNICNKYFSLEQ